MFCLILLFLFIIYLSLKIVVNRKSDSVACLVGKTAIVTGGNSGLGYATSLLLASRGCKVIIADVDNAEKTIDKIIKLTGNPNIVYMPLDLSSFENVRKFAGDIKKTEKKVDILINNAGIASSNEKGKDGLSIVMKINYFGPFLLTHLLLDELRAAENARVIFNGSITTFLHNLTPENLNSTGCDDITDVTLNVYCNSKLCNVLAAQEMSKKLKANGITVNSVDPGLVKTSIWNKPLPLSFKVISFLISPIFGQDPIDGAQTIFHVATSERFKNKNGGHYIYLLPYFKPSILKDRTFCDAIWRKTEELVMLAPEEKL